MSKPLDCSCGVSSRYEELYNSKDHADVTFVLPDGEIQAHKFVLIVGAPYFEAMFSAGMKESQTNRVEVPDSNKKSFDAFLRFIYSGQLPDDFDRESLLILSKKYDVPKVAQHCVTKLVNELSPLSLPVLIQRVVALKPFAKKYQLFELEMKFEELLMSRVDRFTSRIISGSILIANKEKEYLGGLVNILIFSHVEGFSNMKKLCMRCFDKCRCIISSSTFTEAESLKEKLAEHPDLLFEMVWRPIEES